jgi:hypothetical protein
MALFVGVIDTRLDHSLASSSGIAAPLSLVRTDEGRFMVRNVTAVDTTDDYTALHHFETWGRPTSVSWLITSIRVHIIVRYVTT